MGVLACDRRGCRNVMCDRISSDSQYYICNSCFEELVARGKVSLSEFMNTTPKPWNAAVDPRTYWESRFRRT